MNKHNTINNRFIIGCFTFIFTVTSVVTPDTFGRISKPAPKTALSVTAILKTEEAKPIFDRLAEYAASDMRVEFSRKGKDGEPLVVLLRDIHCQQDAQMAIARAIKSFFVSFSIKNVYMEGAAGDVDMDMFRSFPDGAARERAGKEFLKQGYLTGPEFVLLTGGLDLPLSLTGVEEEKTYIENLKTFRKTKTVLGSVAEEIAIVRETVRRLFVKELSGDLLTLFQYSESLNGNADAKTEEIFTGLTEISVESGQNVPENLQKFIELLNLQRPLDNEKLAAEKEKFSKQMESELVKEDLQKLIEMSLKYRTGKMNSAQYIAYLKELYGERAPSFDESYPMMALWEKAEEAASKIDFGSICREMEDTINVLMQKKAAQSGLAEELDINREWRLWESLINLKVPRTSVEEAIG
jgi:hypothetical protein